MILNLFGPESSVRFPGQLPTLGLAFASPFECSYSLPSDGFVPGLFLLDCLILSVELGRSDRVLRQGLRPL